MRKLPTLCSSDLKRLEPLTASVLSAAGFRIGFGKGKMSLKVVGFELQILLQMLDPTLYITGFHQSPPEDEV